MPVDDNLSRAVVAFVSREPHGFPHLDPEALKAECGDAFDSMLPRVDGLVAEMMTLPFESEDLGAATRAAKSIMSERHPELGADAIAALGCFYSYSWR